MTIPFENSLKLIIAGGTRMRNHFYLRLYFFVICKRLIFRYKIKL